MNRLSTEKRAEITRWLLSGASIRSISNNVRYATASGKQKNVSINTITSLLVDAGEACAAFHDETVRDVRSRRVQVDEAWSFVYAKQKNVEAAKAAPVEAGDIWTWTAIDADSKLLISWFLGPRDARSAYPFIVDVSERVAGRIQLTSDGLSVYPGVVEDVFGADVDYAQLVKIYGAGGDPTSPETRYSPAVCTSCVVKPVTGKPDPKHISTSYVERHNLTIRMSVRRYARLTNAFSKKLANHAYHAALFGVWYNFCRMHKTLRMTPAMKAGVTDTLRDEEWIVSLIDARATKPQKPGPKPGTKYRPRRKSN